jgi:hypothetical protein
MVTKKTNFISTTMLLIFIFIHAYLPKKLKLSGSANRSVKPQKFNSDISPHRAGIFIHLCFAST